MSLLMVEIVNVSNEVLAFPMDDTQHYFISNIDGLDPVKAEIVESEYGTIDGTQYQSARRGPRNPVLTIGYNPDYGVNTVGALRQNIYSKVMPKAPVTLRFHTEFTDPLHPLEIKGYVETVETPMFTREPECKISVICQDPDFVLPEPITIGTTAAHNTPELVINYAGTSDTGFVAKFTANRALPAFNLIHRTANYIVTNWEYNGTLQTGDILELSTVPGNKGAWLTRAGVRNSVLYHVSKISGWPKLVPGNNYFKTLFSAGSAQPAQFVYQRKYGGL